MEQTGIVQQQLMAVSLLLQMEQTGIVQQQLLQHLLTEEGGLDATVLSLIAEAGQQEPSDGSASDGETADQPSTWAAPARDKARRKTTTTQELLFASSGGGDPAPTPAGSLPGQEPRGTRPGSSPGSSGGGGGDAEGRLAMPPPAPPVPAIQPPPVFTRSLSHTVSGNDTVSASSRWVDTEHRLTAVDLVSLTRLNQSCLMLRCDITMIQLQICTILFGRFCTKPFALSRGPMETQNSHVLQITKTKYVWCFLTFFFIDV